MKYSGWTVALLPLLLSACGGTPTWADREDFQSDPRHRRELASAAMPVCAAAQRVLLGDGYHVEGRDGTKLVGVKEFQIEEAQRAVVHVYVSCSPREKGSTLFVTATEEHFDVKTSRESTSLGVPLVAPISVSSQREADHQVKTYGETITDRSFYARFHQAVQRELGGVLQD